MRGMILGAAAAAVSAAAGAPTPARATGSLRVCASALTNFDDTPAIALPAGLLFTEWGPDNGDLRQVRLDPDYPPARAAGARAVVLTSPLSLTAEKPCAVGPARAVVSARHGWRDAPVAPGPAVFLAGDTLGPDGPRALDGEERALYAVLTMNVLAARPLTPIGDPETVP